MALRLHESVVRPYILSRLVSHVKMAPGIQGYVFKQITFAYRAIIVTESHFWVILYPFYLEVKVGHLIKFRFAPPPRLYF